MGHRCIERVKPSFPALHGGIVAVRANDLPSLPTCFVDDDDVIVGGDGGREEAEGEEALWMCEPRVGEVTGLGGTSAETGSMTRELASSSRTRRRQTGGAKIVMVGG